MPEIVAFITQALEKIRVLELDQLRKDTESEMKVMKLERGMEAMQERLKEKDSLITELKEHITFLRPQKGQPPADKK